ncbi:hypothetical protein FGB62_216g032 [Gracilaria domingensis]|nr:hypothetical protein FGB62_216g032 [Gracilaria domingensis]
MLLAHPQSAAFVKTPLLFATPSAKRRSTCARRPPTANINDTTDRSREDEIAAKIAKLRKQKRLKSQSSGVPDDAVTQTPSSPNAQQQQQQQAEKPYSFSDLPDWKKEQILSNQIQEAEQFFNKGSSLTSAADSSKTKNSEDDYQPRVATWGVFPRPDNISRTYGGGRRIQKGGVDLDSEESKARDEAVRKRLEAYRKGKGIDMKKEEEHREQLEQALEQSEKLMKKTLPYEAINCLEQVTQFTSDRSRLGGKLYLSLAFAYEAVGRREDARQIYARLRSNPFAEISSKAKQLVLGFEAMQQLGVDDETQKTGYRVMRFSLPDMNAQVEKRYETVVRHEDDINSETEKISLATNIMLNSVSKRIQTSLNGLEPSANALRPNVAPKSFTNALAIAEADPHRNSRAAERAGRAVRFGHRPAKAAAKADPHADSHAERREDGGGLAEVVRGLGDDARKPRQIGRLVVGIEAQRARTGGRAAHCSWAGRMSAWRASSSARRARRCI